MTARRRDGRKRSLPHSSNTAFLVSKINIYQRLISQPFFTAVHSSFFNKLLLRRSSKQATGRIAPLVQCYNSLFLVQLCGKGSLGPDPQRCVFLSSEGYSHQYRFPHHFKLFHLLTCAQQLIAQPVELKGSGV